MIEEYEAELARFKSHYEEMMERQEKIFALGPIDPERHLFLKENAEIVLVGLDWHCDANTNFSPWRNLRSICLKRVISLSSSTSKGLTTKTEKCASFVLSRKIFSTRKRNNLEI